MYWFMKLCWRWLSISFETCPFTCSNNAVSTAACCSSRPKYHPLMPRTGPTTCPGCAAEQRPDQVRRAGDARLRLGARDRVELDRREADQRRRLLERPARGDRLRDLIRARLGAFDLGVDGRDLAQLLGDVAARRDPLRLDRRDLDDGEVVDALEHRAHVLELGAEPPVGGLGHAVERGR